MKTKITLSLFMWFCAAIVSYAQGTLQITFDGPPVQALGTAAIVTNYFESKMSFTSINPMDGFVRVGANPVSFRPDDGSAYIQAAIGESLMFSFTNGSVFSLHSVDLAGYSTVVPDVSAYFVGYYPDGSTMSTNFPASGIVFQTFYFGSGWSGLTRVEVPDFGSLDNLVVSVPEPATGELLLVGGLLIFGLRKCNNQ